MAKDVVTATADERLTTAARRMRERRIGALAVVDDDRLAGIITERDLLFAIADGVDPAQVQVSDYMTHGPHTIEPSDLAAEVASRMVDMQTRHFPVMSEGRLVGLLSIRDLVKLGVHLSPHLVSLELEPW